MIKFVQSLLGSQSAPQVETQDFFLIGGQSNTGTNTTQVSDQTPTGRVDYSLIPDELTGEQNYSVFDGLSNGFVSFTHTVNKEYGWINHFLKDVADAGNIIGFYKWGQGGNQLTAGDDPFTSYPRNILKDNGLLAWNEWQSLHENPRLIFLWCQGYTDALDETNANNYSVTLSDWFSEIRTHFNEPNMKIIFNGISNNATGATFRAQLKIEQQEVAAESTNNIFVDADNLDFQDAAHFSNVGVFGLADRYLTKYSNL